MENKPITVSKFYSKKDPDIRIVFPSERHDISEDSDCNSDDSEDGLDKRRIKSDLIIPASSPDSNSDKNEESAPKKSLPKRRRIKRIISSVTIDRYADFQINKPTKPPSSRKLEFTSPKNGNIQNTAAPLQSLKNIERGKKISYNVWNLLSQSYLNYFDTVPITGEDFFSQEEDFSLKLQLSQDDLVNENVDDLSSPCISSTPSLLASPIHSDSDVDLKKILSHSRNYILRNTSPDLFQESDSATHFSPEIMPLHSVGNLRDSPYQTSANKARARIVSNGECHLFRMI